MITCARCDKKYFEFGDYSAFRNHKFAQNQDICEKCHEEGMRNLR